MNTFVVLGLLIGAVLLVLLLIRWFTSWTLFPTKRRDQPEPLVPREAYAPVARIESVPKSSSTYGEQEKFETKRPRPKIINDKIKKPRHSDPFAPFDLDTEYDNALGTTTPDLFPTEDTVDLIQEVAQKD